MSPTKAARKLTARASAREIQDFGQSREKMTLVDVSDSMASFPVRRS